MIRIVCPFCHVPLSLQELIPAQLGARSCLLCPGCLGVLVTDPVPTVGEREDVTRQAAVARRAWHLRVFSATRCAEVGAANRHSQGVCGLSPLVANYEESVSASIIGSRAALG